MARPIPITYGFELEARDGTIAVIRDRDAYDLRTLPHAEQVAALVALLRECPDAAVEAVDRCKVARPWVSIQAREPLDMCRRPLGSGNWIASGGVPRHGGGWYSVAVVGDRVLTDGRVESPEESYAAADAALVVDGWVLAGVPRVG